MMRAAGTAPIAVGRAFPAAQPTDVHSGAEAAIDLVRDGDTLIIGAGCAGEQLAGRLVARTGLTVVTNSLTVARILSGTSAEVILTAGTARGLTGELLGDAAVGSLRHLHVARAFLGGDAFSARRGLTHRQEASAAVTRAMTDAAGDVVVLIDRQGFDRDAPHVGVLPDAVIAVLVADHVPDGGSVERTIAAGTRPDHRRRTERWTDRTAVVPARRRRVY